MSLQQNTTSLPDAPPDSLNLNLSLTSATQIYAHGADRIVWSLPPPYNPTGKDNDILPPPYTPTPQDNNNNTLPTTILKRTAFSPTNSATEAATHHFLTNLTTTAHPSLKLAHFPSPRVFAEWTSRDKKHHYLLEEQVPGTTLGAAWPRLTMRQKVAVAEEVSSWMSRLARAFPGEKMESVCGRRLPGNGFVPPYMVILNADEGRGREVSGDCLGGRWRTDEEVWRGEFLPRLRGMGVEERVVREVRRTMPPVETELALTHCDLYHGNVMVDTGEEGDAEYPDGIQVTGIIDWESAGYWPKWFQFARITYGVDEEVDDEWKWVLSEACRRRIPFADHGRVWWDVVTTLCERPGSMTARAWLALLGRFVDRGATEAELRGYQRMTREEARREIERQADGML
ncbi:uncharacterized protein C8A04DRAFT_29877 [Dichotomopilus funicola]|uniref:Aminoglycoside phosphotransferase domain-containing protein n=1 Tax=Dichotomopilus funicola TaxID=1934379 RepID=A0AAN6V0U4_9PEZI|nr:hypothetical protein C8A04DRAFT_29877 [Dichotomopilus funicola]